MRACGWWSLNPEKIVASQADYWVFVLIGFQNRSTDFVVMKPTELLARLRAIHGRQKRVQSYLWVTQQDRCFETRGLKRTDQLAVAQGQFKNNARDFSRYLNNWAPVRELNGK
jgi:hypothetical protein